MENDGRKEYLADAKQRKLARKNAKEEIGPQRYYVEMCGKKFTLRCRKRKREESQNKYRGPCTHFSRRARAAKLRRIAEVRWKDIGETQFLTLTYPDEVSDHTMEERKVHRFLLNRSICQWVGRPLACFWRVEWMPRLSGKYVGEMRPHMHMLYMNTPRICEMRIRLRWMAIIGVSTYTQVKIKPLAIPEAVSVYVSKYCAKEASHLVLDNVPKRNRTGRHAGELRKELIPLHPLEVVTLIDDAIVRFLRGRACETLWWYDPRFDEGFTILGDVALEYIRDFNDLRIDATGRIA
jgi:hypothetical protein